MKNLSVESLRQQGYKVRVTHMRYFGRNSFLKPVLWSMYEAKEELYNYTDLILSNGGLTKVEITIPESNKTLVGISKCSIKDSYNKKLGVKIALGRALVNNNE